MLHEFRLPVSIFLGGLVLLLLLIPTGLDAYIAETVIVLKGDWAWFLRQHAALPMTLISLAALGFLLLPWIRRRFPETRHLAVVWLLTMLLGGGLLNQVIVQEVVDRPRPRESVLVADEGAARLSGHSFPSGHATLGFMFMAPFFVWRHARPLWARFALISGLLAGLVVGLARMALGAHYLTDILWAGIIVAISAWFFNRYIPRKDVPTWLTLGILLTAVGALILGNRFDVTLRYNVPFQRVDLPCDLEEQSGDEHLVSVHVEGYGAPLSQLLLYADDGVVKLQRWRGLYHSLSCEGTVTKPLDN